jgi:hypothetical protein
MESKKIQVREYTVRAHTRTIHTREYQLICQFCYEEAERESYATCCPKYGNKCGGVEKKCKRFQKK